MRAVVRSATTHSRRGSKSTASSTLGPILYVLAGPTVWALHLGIMYGAQSVLCALSTRHAHDGAPLIHSVIGGATVIAVACLIAMLASPDGMRRVLGIAELATPTRRTLDRVAMLLTALSLFAIVIAAMTPLFLAVCDSGR